jgi:HEAT repeat protein
MMTELATALAAESAATRWLAISKLNQPNSVPVDAPQLALLAQALGDAHPFVRWQAGLALARQANGRPKIVEALRDNAPETSLKRAAAIDALSIALIPAASPLLIEQLQAKEPLLRQSAAEALAAYKDPSAVSPLMAAMQDPDPWVRRATAYALGHGGRPEAIPVLLAALRDRSVLVRRSVAYALGALRAAEALPRLTVLLTDADPMLRRNAAWALGRIGRSEVAPNLKNLLTDSALNGTVAATARQAIATLSKPRWLQRIPGFNRH